MNPLEAVARADCHAKTLGDPAHSGTGNEAIMQHVEATWREHLPFAVGALMTLSGHISKKMVDAALRAAADKQPTRTVLRDAIRAAATDQP